MRKPLLVALAVASLTGFGLATPLLAHHSFAMFDMKKEVTTDAVVTEFQWTNPHAWIHVDIVDARGEKTNWALEMTSPNNLVVSGWRRSSLKPGDKVKAVYHPLLNGKSGGSLARVTLASGVTLENK